MHASLNRLIFGVDNGLLPVRPQAIIYTNDDFLSTTQRDQLKKKHKNVIESNHFLLTKLGQRFLSVILLPFRPGVWARVCEWRFSSARAFHLTIINISSANNEETSRSGVETSADMSLPERVHYLPCPVDRGLTQQYASQQTVIHHSTSIAH